MGRPRGYAIIVDPDAPTWECDTITCKHCQRIVLVKPGKDATDVGGFCRLCFAHICGPCADLGSCTPFEKKMEAAEKRDEMLRSMGL